jgi:putative ABC transport system permease protein
VVRTAGHPELYTQAVEEQFRKEDADQPVYDVRSMEEWVGRTLESRTLLTGTVTLFSVVSLLLACIGLYGVVSYMADLRLREFGIRIALGAGAGHVRGLVLRQAGALAFWGCAIGLTLSWPVGRALQSLLFGVTGGDVISWLVAPALLISVALLSGLGPAGKAAKADPAVTLRAE